MDNGIVQAVLNKRGGLNGNEFESAVIAEIYKQAKIVETPVKFSFLRTHDGKEVDLLLEMADGYYAFEIKMSPKATRTDARHLFGLENILDKPVKKAFVLSNDPTTTQFDEKTYAINVSLFLG